MRARRQRDRHVGTSGHRHGRLVHVLDPRRPPAHRAPRGRRSRAATPDAVLPRHRQPRLWQGGERRRAVRRRRAEPGVALGRRRSVGSRRARGAARPRALRAADGRRGAALPLPRRGRRDRARLPPRRDDAGRESAARAHARRARLLDCGGTVAERLRRSRRARESARRARHRRRGRGRRPAVPSLALRRAVPGRVIRRRGRTGGLQVLLQAEVPAGRVRSGQAEAALPASAAERRARRGLRSEERLGARRVVRARQHGAPRRRGAASRGRLGATAVARPGRGRARRDPRARGDPRHDLVREARALGTRRARAGLRLRESTGPSGRSRTPSSSTSAATSSAT